MNKYNLTDAQLQHCIDVMTLERVKAEKQVKSSWKLFLVKMVFVGIWFVVAYAVLHKDKPEGVQYMNGVPYKLSSDGKNMLRVR